MIPPKKEPLPRSDARGVGTIVTKDVFMIVPFLRKKLFLQIKIDFAGPQSSFVSRTDADFPTSAVTKDKRTTTELKWLMGIVPYWRTAV